VVREVAAFLRERAAFAMKAGVKREAICLDPGIGFGKTLEHNLALLRGLPAIKALGFPVLVGVSRKGFLGQLAQAPEPQDRLAAGLAASAWAIQGGASVLRAHDVAPTVQAARVADALAGKGGS
jgi:dihydropteroate synthase